MSDIARDLDKAHRQYFQDVQTVFLEVQDRHRAAAATYERAMIRANDEAAVRSAAEELQRQIQGDPEEYNPEKACADAFGRYMAAVQSALAGATEQIDHATTVALGQSLQMVATHAAWLAALTGRTA